MAVVSFNRFRFYKRPEFDVVERKGLGHPDTLADRLAEKLSVVYSRYTLEHFGAVLHHNFDKVGLMGGSSYVKFGEGHLTNPIRVLINGRASSKFGNTIIPLQKMLVDVAKDFLVENLFGINKNKDIKILFEVSTSSSPGKTNERESNKGTRRYWFTPRNLDDLAELKFLGANDTSLGCAAWPLTDLEELVFFLEQKLNSSEFKKIYPWCGSDIKIMGVQTGEKLHLTFCVPQIAHYVASMDEYKQNLEEIKNITNQFILEHNYDSGSFTIHLNTRDDFDLCELYMTATGSSIESGDEGFVGRGNRVNGLISPLRPVSMEGVSGKNPVYHIGKLYNIAALKIAKRIYDELLTPSEVFLVSQSGRSLIDPWQCHIVLGKKTDTKFVKHLVQEEMENMAGITRQLIKEEIFLW